ncbi:MAG TPA: OpcA/G6PD domain-containing protein, partial [Thermomicrobiales bacterium]|nr:OpcA/G6PD domain-containing protein [Thermomicrobiales bacterium]
GLSAALLAVGWLASRLGWDAIEPLDTNKAGVSWAPLRARGTSGRQRDIQIRLTPDNSPQARFSLRRVELIATGEAPGVFRVERTDDDDLVTSSETPSVPFVSRMVYSKRPENARMLHSEVQRLSSDRVYEEALRTAAKLLP